jgi:hypothetical protein
MAGGCLNARHELDGGCARSHDGDALPAEIVSVIPVGRVERRPSETRQPRDLRHPLLAERAVRHDKDVGRLDPRRRRDLPALLSLEPASVGERGIEPDVLDDAVALGRPAEVGDDLRLLGVRTTPIRVRGEREGVQV